MTKHQQNIKCVIVSGGTFSLESGLKKKIIEADLIIAADHGGEKLMKLGIFPHYLIGDMDSIHPDILEQIKKTSTVIISYPSKKDYTDTELCIKFAREKGASDITLLAATGSRGDHSTANIFLLEPLCKDKIQARIIDSKNTIQMLTGNGIKKTSLVRGKKEDFVSILAVSETVTGLNLKGLEYPLNNARIQRGQSLGISNYFKNTTAEISIESGTLLVFQSRD